MILETEIEFEGGLVDAVIEYTYTPGEDAITNRAPGDCYEGTPAEIEITGLRLKDGPVSVDVTFLCADRAIEEKIEERIWSSLE